MKITNQYLAVEASELGASLTSVYDLSSHKELLYQKDGSWANQDHVLFPIIGPAKNYTCDGKGYSCPSQHGFARDSTFVASLTDEATMSFALCDNEVTLGYYPYHFSLEVTYHLQNNALKRSFFIINKGTSPLPFMVGSHAAYKVEFGKAYLALGGKVQYLPRPSLIMELTPKDLPMVGDWHFSKDDFKKYETIVLVNPRRPITLVTGRGETLTYHFHSPYIAIWSPVNSKDAFICVEPWWGLPIYKDMPNELKERKGINLIGGSALFEETISFKEAKED
jgi:galactose mutarotase-like enzyme